MKVKVKGGSGTLELADATFGAAFNGPLVHQVVTAYLAGARAGTKAQKNRSDVSGSGKKPWKQKGTGRARVGSIRSPIWVGGGRTFAARPRSFEQKVNRKMYRGAMRSVLSELLRQERLIVTPELQVSEAKTKALRGKLEKLGFTTGLVIVEAFDMKLWLAARNLPGVDVLEAQLIDPVSLVGASHVVVTAAALKIIEERVK
ncbi:MAG TPA: 50S ribosomal protein L4 [Gammaproteobacteria bacterium]|nr:50S ribosomal protein L4 [Gammaproteobacteria bacterium]